MANSNGRRVLTERETAEYLNISHRTLQKLRVVGGGPQYVKIGRSVRYRAADLDAFLTAGERQNTSKSR